MQLAVKNMHFTDFHILVLRTSSIFESNKNIGT